jgi:4'-phosphopantetheinyl transferase
MIDRPEARRGAACEVWWATPSDRTDLVQPLDDTEQRRARRLRHAGDRRRFVTARALLRLVLAERIGTTPTELRFDTTCLRCGGDHGKPRLIGHGGAVSFSIGHSGDRVVVAVADGAAVGVDVESIEARDAGELAALSDSILGPTELADYERIAPPERGRALAVWWSRKEAVLKATGHGLTVPMADVSVTAPDEPAALRSPHGPGAAAMVTMRDLDPGDGGVACLAAIDVSSLSVTERDGDQLLSRSGPL